MDLKLRSSSAHIIKNDQTQNILNQLTIGVTTALDVYHTRFNGQIKKLYLEYCYECPIVRTVSKEDCNNFYRAFFFIYLENLISKPQSQEQIKQMIQSIERQKIQLNTVHQSSIPPQLLPYYQNASQELVAGLQKIITAQCPMHVAKVDALRKIMCQNKAFEFASILFVRSLALNSLLQFQNELGFFYIGDEENLVRFYNQGISNVIIRVLAEKLNINVLIKEFDQNAELLIQIKPECNKNVNERFDINLLHIDQYYDITYKRETLIELYGYKHLAQQTRQQYLLQFYQQLEQSQVSICKKCRCSQLQTDQEKQYQLCQECYKKKLVNLKCVKCNTNFQSLDRDPQILCQNCIKISQLESSNKKYICQCCQIKKSTSNLQCQQCQNLFSLCEDCKAKLVDYKNSFYCCSQCLAQNSNSTNNNNNKNKQQQQQQMECELTSQQVYIKKQITPTPMGQFSRDHSNGIQSSQFDMQQQQKPQITQEQTQSHQQKPQINPQKTQSNQLQPQIFIQDQHQLQQFLQQFKEDLEKKLQAKMEQTIQQDRDQSNQRFQKLEQFVQQISERQNVQEEKQVDMENKIQDLQKQQKNIDIQFQQFMILYNNQEQNYFQLKQSLNELYSFNQKLGHNQNNRNSFTIYDQIPNTRMYGKNTLTKNQIKSNLENANQDASQISNNHKITSIQSDLHKDTLANITNQDGNQQ